MACKHLKVEGNTTKYFYCTLFNKSIDKYKCLNCLMKIENQEELLRKMFGEAFGFEGGFIKKGY